MPFDFSSIDWAFIGIQLIGFVAMGLAFASYQAKHRTNILIIQILSSSLWCLQFLLLNSPAGLINNALAIVRNALFSQKEKQAWAQSRLLPAAFIVLFIAAAAYSYTLEGPLCLLPLVGMILQTIAYASSKERNIRILSLFVSPPWLVYDAIRLSAAGVMCESLNIVSIIIALCRFRKKKEAR